MNKAIERAGEDVFGKQGLGHYTPYQLLYVLSTLMKHSIKSYGQENVDIMWSSTITKLRMDSAWEKEAKEMHKQALFTLINELEAADDALEAIKAIEVYLKKAPPQKQDPVFTRWKTVGETNRIFVKVYAIFYHFTVAVKQNAESKF